MFKEKELILIISRNLLKSAITAIIAVFVVLFLSGQISKISESIVKNKRTAFILEKRNETISNLRNDLKLIGDNERKIEDAMPPVDNILDFVAALENLASQNSLQQSLKFGTPSQVVAGQISSIDYYITLNNGNTATLLNYLKRFERLPYVTGISTINLQALTARGWEDNSSVSIQGKIYVRQNGGR